MNRFTKYPHLFSPIKVRDLTIKNRIEIPPMGINLGRSDGFVTAEYYLWVKRLAKSGAGLVTVSDAGIDFELSGGAIAGPRLDSEDKLPGLSRLVDEIHRYDAAASIELTHYGVVAHPDLVRPLGSMMLSSSDIYWDIDGVKTQVAREMTKDEIKEVIRHYCRAAKLCQTAGFDMIMIHAAHGQLPAQFLSPFFNQRTDEYGGCAENRMRFPLELLAALREAVGPDFPIEYRISGDEVDEKGMRIEDTVAFLERAQEYIDLVHISAGIDPSNPERRFNPSYMEAHNVNADCAQLAKQRLNIPVAVVGGISYHEDAERIIAEGKADMVSIGRATICDLEGHKKAELGLEDEIRPCLRCGHCGRASRAMGTKTTLCAVNPTAARELEYMEIYPAPIKKRVMIVGGGPGGMQAAITACQRGHEVELYEASDRLGGLLHTAAALPFKEDMRRYVKWLIRQAETCGAKIYLNTKVDATLIQEKDPDAVILAIGAEPFVPNIPGSELPHVVLAGDVDTGDAQVNGDVVVIGAGLTGMESAVQIASDGHKVTIVDLLPTERWFDNVTSNISASLRYRLDLYDIERIGNASVSGITESSVEVEQTGRKRVLSASTVVMATGMRPNMQELEQLSSVVRFTRRIGDCNKASNLLNAIHSGFQAAVDL